MDVRAMNPGEAALAELVVPGGAPGVRPASVQRLAARTMIAPRARRAAYVSTTSATVGMGTTAARPDPMVSRPSLSSRRSADRT